MHYIDSIIYCSQLSMSRENSDVSRDSSLSSSPIVSPSPSPLASPSTLIASSPLLSPTLSSSSFLNIPENINNVSKSPIEVIAKKRGTSYQNLTISTSSIKKQSLSIYLKSPKVHSSSEVEFMNSPYTDSPFPNSPCLNSSLTPHSACPLSPNTSKKPIKKPLHMLPIFKPIVVTNENYISSKPSYYKIYYSHSKLYQNEFSFIPVNDRYEKLNANIKENSYSCHGIKFSKNKSILTNKGSTILNIKKRAIFNNKNKEKICDILYLNKMDEHFKIIVEITNKIDNDKITIVCASDAYNQTAFIYNNYPDKGGTVIGLISRMNNFEEKVNRGWVLEIAAKVDIPLIMAISIFNLKNLTEILSKY
ncbi:hypothetical protein BCR32DRAFT_268694 [Anaeromyces robustus]|uniref:Uncharacterized protein n=1 Tax=Anaeromyces robustus TaxID=1754192 RepID=A0A1Y1X604_9FUNG|nr:hypothetical protein BCR32DRAFT_268694 [Anaeromyces robustus]|eukprot:ORX80724.1 hypothetical protein BCR32DRAFT_268694 [Anaeromyces robustus]